MAPDLTLVLLAEIICFCSPFLQPASVKTSPNFRTPVFLQPALDRAGHRVAGRRVADGHGQHQHVHLRDRARLHPHGERVPRQDARDHRLPGTLFSAVVRIHYSGLQRLSSSNSQGFKNRIWEI